MDTLVGKNVTKGNPCGVGGTGLVVAHQLPEALATYLIDHRCSTCTDVAADEEQHRAVSPAASTRVGW